MFNNLLHVFLFRWKSTCLCITTTLYYIYFIFVGKAHVCTLLKQSITDISFALPKHMPVHYYNNLLHSISFSLAKHMSVHYYNNLLVYFIFVGKTHACALPQQSTCIAYISFPLAKHMLVYCWCPKQVGKTSIELAIDSSSSAFH